MNVSLSYLVPTSFIQIHQCLELVFLHIIDINISVYHHSLMKDYRLTIPFEIKEMNDDSGDDDDTHNDGGLNVGHLHTIK